MMFAILVSPKVKIGLNNPQGVWKKKTDTLIRKIDPTKNDEECTFWGNKNIGLGKKDFWVK